MTAEFIDQVLTPIGGGVGGAIGMYLVSRRRASDFAAFGGPAITSIGVGVVVALALFFLR